jgi:hypothetical protein
MNVHQHIARGFGLYLEETSRALSYLELWGFVPCKGSIQSVAYRISISNGNVRQSSNSEAAYILQRAFKWRGSHRVPTIGL